ncbi:Lrp/AsnC family transcriptional regulator [Exiguobacterium sp. s131]|uniref:Lrp/AsnC family transcriptional regulator n=1 Tax=Exiguobacterium sp. s131 TaxID=2751278 RepID=UPI001BE5DE68|nr:Lrp/AsnC family transcriptional regulator [Exiguobacterium sp. s131]
MDATDRRIIEALQQNSRMTMKELGELVHLTGQATATRVKKLEDLGIIEGYTIRINEDQIGLPIHAMITIYTTSTFHDPYLLFLKDHRPYVRHNYKVSGDGCYLLECRFPTNQELNAFLDGLSKYVNYKLSLVIHQNTQ